MTRSAQIAKEAETTANTMPNESDTRYLMILIGKMKCRIVLAIAQATKMSGGHPIISG
jgi:hypothetical protein